MIRVRPGWALAGAALLLAAFALLRAPDHDESQYVAAAVLTAQGLLPYRDFAWLQGPLQPFAFAPLAAMLGALTWPGLRLANAALGLVALAGLYRVSRMAGAARPVALAATALFAGCDAFLFGAATARNDMLPLALFAWGLAAALRLATGGGRAAAVAAGALLAAAAAAKVSYAFPALAFGGWCLLAPRGRHASWVILGALPVGLFVAVTAGLAPAGFRFGVIDFPLLAPADFYADRPDKLAWWAKPIDFAKFLALGAAPVVLLAWRRGRTPAARLLDVFLLAGLVAAILPTPVWRQYLLPLLAPLFVQAALAWQARPPGAAWRIATVVFAAAGLAPSLLQPWSYPTALREARAVGAATGTAPIVTLSPQFVTNPDPRFSTGPFVWRSRALLDAGDAARLGVAIRGAPLALRGRAVLVGGEGAWTAGDIRLDRALATEALRQGYRPVAIPGSRFVLLRASTPS